MHPCGTLNYASEARSQQISGSVGEQSSSKLYLVSHKNNCFITLALVLLMWCLNKSSLEVNRFYHPWKELIGIVCASVVDIVIPKDLSAEVLTLGLTC